MKCLKLAFIYKNNHTFCYVKFLYTNIQTPRNKKDNLRYFFINNNPDTFRYAIFMEFLKLAEMGGGGGHFYM